jgi:hypothetical protein
MRCATQKNVAEWVFSSSKSYDDPSNDVTLDVRFIGPDGSDHLMPAFWAGDHDWRVRYAPEQSGRNALRTVCSDTSNADLNGCVGEFEALPAGAPTTYSATVVSASPRTIGTWSMRTARHSPGWETPGGWGSPSACPGRPAFRS